MAATKAADTVCTSEGQRLLRAVPGSLGDIADAVGCRSRQTVADWKSGAKAPNAHMRAQLFGAFGIPAGAWSVLPGTTTQSHAPSAVMIDTSSAPTTLEQCRQLLETIRQDRMRQGLMPAERVKLADSEARLLSLKNRLEKEAELLETRIVLEHPAWHRIKRVLAKTLAAHPAAAKAVADALLESAAG